MNEEFDMNDWIANIIEGPGGMNDFEQYECVAWNEPERVAAVRWAIRCLGNPDCKGSAEMLESIMQQREFVSAQRK